jgi:hypothetical protein
MCISSDIKKRGIMLNTRLVTFGGSGPAGNKILPLQIPGIAQIELWHTWIPTLASQ